MTWARHVLDRLADELARRPDDVLAGLRAELLRYLPPSAAAEPSAGPRFAVPLRLATDGGELRLPTTVSTFATATDVTVAELKLEAFRPADAATAVLLAETPAARGDPSWSVGPR